MIQVTFNAQQKQWDETLSLKDILEKEAYAGDYFAIAKNNQFIPRHLYGSTFLNDGDVIDIISPMQGG